MCIFKITGILNKIPVRQMAINMINIARYKMPLKLSRSGKSIIRKIRVERNAMIEDIKLNIFMAFHLKITIYT